MKNYLLYKDQKEKLLQLCKSFFPEYNAIYLINKSQEEEYNEEDFIEMSVYTVDSLSKSPGYNRKLHDKITKESSALRDKKDKDWTWWDKSIVEKYSKLYDIPQQPCVTIHFYELCVTELAKRIAKKYNLSTTSIQIHILSAPHPVDALYEHVQLWEKINQIVLEDS